MGYNKLIDDENIEKILLKYNFGKEVLETELNILLKEYEFNYNYNPVEHIKSRIKTSDSALKKLEKKGYEFTTENLVNHVNDMIGIRIVCSFLSDVKSIVEILRSSKLFKIKEENDYITSPKDSGYISYHMNVLVPIHLYEKTEYVEAEIQIRTIAMDFWASLDHKLRYKKNECIPKDLMNEVYSCSQVINDLDLKMENLKQKFIAKQG